MAKSPNERSSEALESNMLKDVSNGWTSIADSCDVTAGVAMVGSVGRYYMEDFVRRGELQSGVCVRGFVAWSVCRLEFVPGS